VPWNLNPYIAYRKTMPKNSNNENLHNDYPMHSTCTASEMDAENSEGLRGMVWLLTMGRDVS
jgi:hypothetical protein